MVIRKLDLKLFRDIRFSPWLFLGIVVVVALGITMFDAMYISYDSIGKSYDLTYERLNFADFTIDMISAPQQVEDRIRRIPGIRQVEGRMTEHTPLEINDDTGRLIARIHSLPDRGLPDINSLYITEGALPGPGTTREILVERSFADHHGLSPGEFIYPIVDESRIRFRISGIFMSPEYIYAVPDVESFGPQPEQFGIFFMRRSIMDSIFGTSGTINQIVATVLPDADRDSIMNQATFLLEPYGVEDPIPREEQASYYLLELDLEQLRVMAIFFPVLFLAIASLSIYNLLSRLTLSQRSQIGLMRAMGYTRFAILRHYISFALLIGLLGSVFGTYFGYLIAGWLTDLYMEILAVPFAIVALRYDIMALGVGISLAVSILAGWIPALAASKLTPADAIRPEHPTIGRVPVLEKYIPSLRNASFTWRLPFRNLMRSPKRTFSTVMGVAAAISLILVTAGLMNSITSMIDFYFQNMLRYDAVGAYFNPRSDAEISQIRTWKGVQRVEPSIQLNVTMIYDEDQTVDLQIIGVQRDTQLLAVVGPDRQPVPVPENGIAVGGDFMDIRGLSVGMPVTLALSQRRNIPVADLIPPDIGFRRQVLTPIRGLDRIEVERQVWITQETYQPVGNLVIMDIDEVRRLFSRDLDMPPNAMTGVLVQAEPRYLPEIVDRLNDLPGMATVIDVSDMLGEIDEMLELTNTFIAVMFAFAAALAFVVLFNATTMNIMERTRETASLRALGSSRLQIAAIITIENLITWIIGTIIGIPLGQWIAQSFMTLWQTETFSPRLEIFLSTYIITVFGILITVLISQIPGIRFLNRLNLASATKEITG